MNSSITIDISDRRFLYFKEAEISVHHNDYLKERDMKFGPDHITNRVRNIVKRNRKGPSRGEYRVKLIGSWSCNRLTFNDSFWEVHPDGIGVFTDGKAFCTMETSGRYLTQNVRSKANDLWGDAVLQLVRDHVGVMADQIEADTLNSLRHRRDSLRDDSEAIERAIQTWEVAPC